MDSQTPHKKPTTAQLIAAAIADGTHSTAIRKLCLVCREWCDGIYGDLAYGGGGGIGASKACCKACWEKAHPPGEQVVRAQFIKPTRRYEPTLEDILLLWAQKHLPAAFTGIAQPSTDRQWWDKCLAAIFRAWADNRSEDWMDAVLVTFTGDVRRLAPLIVRAGGWRFTSQWIDARLALAGVAVAAQAVREMKPSIQREAPVGIF